MITPTRPPRPSAASVMMTPEDRRDCADVMLKSRDSAVDKNKEIAFGILWGTLAWCPQHLLALVAWDDKISLTFS